jgi:predicted Rossmann fold nucleotide-binding protein DprA/Smf involved in DNA uptake
MQTLQEQGIAMDMARLSSELLMLEVEGKIVKEAGARYRVCYE